ncbi:MULTISPECIES: type-F conjugative transfer system protein TraW [Enterobacteriaceae]|uniref:Conjugal transfer protein TraW n=1 Tax=Franconibacter pulveris TaxID=435910 RepID=A0A0J8VLQ7_9ENTR|nr:MULTISPECIES: type-F conjugative transfer system protein TraW [Enterobacteriaceae]KMV34081.1 conjugal transfer protein TraW [Franconibacter pulveris]MEB8610157.1 type-F conjugative transfer system protein TraW [Cronobacter sakazakii]
MTRRLHLAALALLACSAGSGAKDLGTWGNLFEPAEQDMLVFIQNRLGAMEKSGELERLQREATDRVKAHAVRPAPVPGLTPAVTYRALRFDPTFTVADTITDMQGRIIARRGDQVNPLDKVPYSETLFFIDGDNREQLAWMKAQLPGLTNFKIILVNGNVRDTSQMLDEQIYFDQAGVLTSKFGFEHTPVRVTRDGRVLKVEEIPVSGDK